MPKKKPAKTPPSKPAETPEAKPAKPAKGPAPKAKPAKSPAKAKTSKAPKAPASPVPGSPKTPSRRAARILPPAPPALQTREIVHRPSEAVVLAFLRANPERGALELAADLPGWLPREVADLRKREAVARPTPATARPAERPTYAVLTRTEVGDEMYNDPQKWFDAHQDEFSEVWTSNQPPADQLRPSHF